MARAAEFRTIKDNTIDAPAGYDKQKLWAAWKMDYGMATTTNMQNDKNILPETW